MNNKSNNQHELKNGVAAKIDKIDCVEGVIIVYVAALTTKLHYDNIKRACESAFVGHKVIIADKNMHIGKVGCVDVDVQNIINTVKKECLPHTGIDNFIIKLLTKFLTEFNNQLKGKEQ